MQIRLTLTDACDVQHDVEVTAPPMSTLTELVRELGLDPDQPLWSGTQKLPGAALVGGPGLRKGDLLALAPKPTETALASLRLQVLGGPSAGRAVALTLGRYLIGRDPHCQLQLDDPEVSRVHAEVVVDAKGVTVRDLGSTNGSQIDDDRLAAGPHPLPPGKHLLLGHSLISVASGGDPPSALRPSLDGKLAINRPPRLDPAVSAACIDLPAAPDAGSSVRLPWVAAMMPAVAGAALAAYLHNLQFLAFSLLSPVIMIGTGLSDRVHGRRGRRRRAAAFQQDEREARSELGAKLADEQRRRRRRHPDPTTAVRTATLPDCNLWQRRPNDPDHLEVRLGLGSVASALTTRRDGVETPAATLSNVPVTIGLRQGPVGLCGPPAIAAGIARWLVAQLAVTQSPVDVQLALLLSPRAASQWTWVRWLPHFGGRVATTPEGRRHLLAELQELVDRRRSGAEYRTEARWDGPWLVVVIDRAGDLADLSGLSSMLAVGPSVGVTAICIDDSRRRLPTACTALAMVAGETGTSVDILDEGGRQRTAIADQISPELAASISRALAPFVDTSADSTTTIPASCRLVDVLDVNELTTAAIVRRWRERRGPRAEVGLAATGVFTVDLVADGPHALVAGTTGSGKSEFLQTLIAALALANSPQQLAFVLIDYKGGAAFSDCARLPHTAGLVTDLDTQLTERALISLDAELRRREELFAGAGAKDLEHYQREHDDLGRLILVVDEFAALAEELPAFITGLVAIAQRGRSLGVHLVLATQRPSGVISPEIRANTSLRIALRVTDPAESSDVVGVASAAGIAKQTPGRAFVRAGNVLTEIQTAHVGGMASSSNTGLSVRPLDEWGRALPVPGASDGSDSQLGNLVELLRRAALSERLPAVERAWLSPLPDQLPLRSLRTSGHPAWVVWGLLDDPARQSQPNLTVRLDVASAVLVAGAPRSGRSSALRTLAISAVTALPPTQLHLYVLDCGGGSLQTLAKLPHCGAVLAREHPEAIATLLRRLTSELQRRQQFAVPGDGSSTGPDDPPRVLDVPHLLVLVDGWESLIVASDEYDNGESIDRALNLIREGPAAGITVAVSGGRGALTARLASCVAEKIVLRMTDPADYALAGIDPRTVPTSMPAGRALRASDGHVAQLAFCEAPGPGAPSGSVDGLADTWPCPPAGHGPFTVRPLPERVRLTDLLVSARVPYSAPQLLRIGVGGDDGAAVSLDLFCGDGRWLVSGPARSGRTTALWTLVAEGRRTGLDLAVAAPRRSPLHREAELLQLPLLQPDAGAQTLLSFRRTVGGFSRGLLLIDDSEAFLDGPADETLCALVRRQAGVGLAVVVAGRSEDLGLTFRGVAAEVRRSRNGVLLQPGPGDGELLGLRLGRIRPARIPGRGLLVTDQRQHVSSTEPEMPLAVQVALP